MKHSRKTSRLNSLLLATTLTAFCACSNVKPLTVEHAVVDLPTPAAPSLPLPEAMDLQRITPIPRGDMVCYSLKDYKAMSHNFAEIYRWTKEARFRMDVCNGSKAK